MQFSIPRLAPNVVAWLVTAVVVVTGYSLREAWIPSAKAWVQQSIAGFRTATTQTGHDHGTSTDDDHDDHGHDDHGHAHDDGESLELSDRALRNLGLTPDYIQPVTFSTFRRSITVPAIIQERPGRTRLQVATPMTGVVVHVHAVAGEAVEPGTLLFRIRLTHEDLVQAQTSFLQTIGELDVERREIARLTDIVQSGTVPRSKLLEREYSRDKLEASLGAQREALRLHGLSEQQVDQIAIGHRLLRELQVFAPSPDDHGDDELKLADRGFQPIVWQPEPVVPVEEAAHLVISDLAVHKGQAVAAGATLCILSDYSQLYIEGLGFEQDAASIAAAVARKWPVTAVIELPGVDVQTIENLQIERLSNEIDLDSRTLRFYVGLPNSIESRTTNGDGNQFIGWQYRPGQRLQVQVPVEEWTKQIVLPIEAVTKEGAEFYVFVQNGKHFDRVAVHVKYRDQTSAVIANDGTLFPGTVVAMRGAHQMQMALKNKSGGGVDPHAGHNH